MHRCRARTCGVFRLFKPGISKYLGYSNLVKKTREEKKEKKCKRHEEKEAEKKAKLDSIQDEKDWETRVHEIIARVGGLRPLIIDAKGDSVVPPTTVADLVPIDMIIIEESRACSEGPPADVVESVP